MSRLCKKILMFASLTASQISSRFLGFLACVANASTPWTSLQCLRDCDNQYAV
jgi:hypothetical protein